MSRRRFPRERTLKPERIATPNVTTTDVKAAAALLAELLKDGPTPTASLQAMAAGSGISHDALSIGAATLGVLRRKDGMGVPMLLLPRHLDALDDVERRTG